MSPFKLLTYKRLNATSRLVKMASIIGKTTSVIMVGLLFSLPVYALTPLTEADLGKVTAQNGKQSTTQLNEIVLATMLAGAAQAVQMAVPVTANLEVEGFEYENKKESPENNDIAGTTVITGNTANLYPVAADNQTITAETIRFNNVRVENSQNTFGSVYVQDVQVINTYEVQFRN
ncbi:hypothetical protein OLMES_2445 [Oleiphilus messinensis]|uniref:Uncharacterized protein n=1 Tax=Oleiphilus messinensis TaxID=141451 RepID=A0A1Y0I9R6_9GAMM|nr:hypothetical protein [Oleiphilus messinensis]ARU56506.1 hypothetical protein OLMES_2445 [Oleiphilus messinensis]